MAVPTDLPLHTELQRIFQIVNKGLFENYLQVPPFVLQPEKKVILRFFPGPNQIVIGKYFSVATLTEIYESLIHEMIHIQIESQGERSNLYHNKRFLQAALNVGFHVCCHKNQGWSVTNFSKQKGARIPSKLLVNYRAKILKEAKFDVKLLAVEQVNIRKMIKKPKICFLKYTCNCPPPHNSIRSGRRPSGLHPLRVLCQDCNSPFTFQDS